MAVLRALRAIHNIGPLLHGCCLDLERVLLVLFVLQASSIRPCSCTCRCVQPWGSLSRVDASLRGQACGVPSAKVAIVASVVPLYLDTASKVTLDMYSRGHNRVVHIRW